MRYFIVSLFAFLGLLTASNAQERGCEAITNASLSKIVPLLDRNDYAQIEPLLQTIESACGNNEVLQRIRIIGLLVQKQSTDAAIQLYLNRSMDDELIKRLDEAANNNYTSIYNRNKAAFYYVPLRHAIDSLVQLKAAAILGSDSYELNPNEEALAFLFSDHVNTYLMRTHKEKPTSRTEQLQNIEINKQGIGYVLHAGVYTPLNAVNPIFKTSPIFGFSVMSPLANNWVFDGFFKVRLNSNSREFEYELYDEVEMVKSPASLMLGGSVGYKFLDLGNFLLLGKVGIAYEGASTGLSETTYWNYYDEYGQNASTTFHYVSTYNLSPGISAMKHVKGRTFIGVQANYHYSPYNNYRRLLTPIASDYVSFELFFKF